MAFQCPSCGGPKLEITFSLELPPSGDDDEITLQTLKCAACDFRGVAVYRESRHGSLDSESWQHDGYPIGDAELEGLYEALLTLSCSPQQALPVLHAHLFCPTKLGQPGSTWG